MRNTSYWPYSTKNALSFSGIVFKNIYLCDLHLPRAKRPKDVIECNRNGVQINKFHSNWVSTLSLLVIHTLHENNNNLVSHKLYCRQK